MLVWLLGPVSAVWDVITTADRDVSLQAGRADAPRPKVR